MVIDAAVFWPILVFVATVVFSAGAIVEKTRNGRYVKKEVCREHTIYLDKRLDNIDRNVERIWGYIENQKGI